MTHVRLALVLFLATSFLAVIPGEADAVVPGAIDRISFSSTAQGTWDVYTRDFDGNSPYRVTTGSGHETGAIWSPDGMKIAYNSSPPAMGPIDIFVMNSEGSNPVNLTAGTSQVAVVHDWSPDGSRLLYSLDANLWSMHPDGSDPQRLTEINKEEWSASWSPDGGTIVFSREGDLWLMDADGSNERPIFERTENDINPTWAPDGRRIAFESSQSGYDNIWVINVDGSNPVNLTNTILSNNEMPAWAPDGSKIAFSSDRDGDWDIWMMNPDGTDLGHLTDNPADERYVDWQARNRVPNANDDIATVGRGRSVEIDVLANDTDPDGETLTVTDIISLPDHGSAVINPSQTITYTHDGGAIPDGRPVDSFDYKVEDTRHGYRVMTVEVWIDPAFDDVPESNVFHDDIIFLAAQGITKGCNPPANTMYCPADHVTRGQMAAFLVRTVGYTDGAGADLFVDDNGSVFEADIDRLGTAGVTRGCNPPLNDRFCPGGYVTRGQMAAFLSRAFGLTNLGQSNLFVDDDGNLFEADIDKLGANGVSRGCNPPANDRFCPNDYVTREQMAAFLRRAVDLVS